MAPQDHNLKSQLSDIQKRLSESTFNTPKRSSTLRRENESSTEGPTSPTENRAPAEKRSFSNLISRNKDRRVSLPPLDNNKTLTSPGKGAGKDMDFVVGLSENLLQECRRLQAENQAKSHKLRSIEDELSKLKASNASLMAKLNDNLQTEERYKDTNWELEMKLQQLTQEMALINESYQKTQKELTKQSELSHEMRTELEEINMNRASLERDFSSNKLSSNTEIQDLKDHVDELNDENSRLNDEIDELRKQLQASTSQKKAPQLLQVPVLKPVESSDDEAELNEPPVSPVKTIPLGNDALQTETLKASLQNAHQTIAKLRSQILKLRQGELASKQSQHTLQTPRKGQSPVNKKKGLPDSVVKNLHIMGNTNRGSTVIYDDSMASLENDEWENYEGDTTSIASSPSKKPQRPRSIISTASKELLDDSDSEIEDAPEFNAPLSTELKTITEEDATRYAEENDLVIISHDEYEKLTTTYEEERKLLVADLSSKDKMLNSLTNQLSQREAAEAQYQKEAKEFKEKLDAAFSEISQKDAHAKELKNQLEEPSDDLLNLAASRKKLQLVPLVEYKTLQDQISRLKQHFEDPPTDFIYEKARTKNMTVVPADEYSDILSQIKKLKSDVTQHETHKSELQNQLQSVQDTHQKAVDDHVSSMAMLKSESTKQIEDLQKELESAHDTHKKALDDHAASIAELKGQSSKEIKNLQQLIDSPSTDYIKQKSDSLGLVAVERVSYDATISKWKSQVDHLTTELSKTKADFEKQISNPSLEYVQQNAEKHGHRAVEIKSHDADLAKLAALSASVIALESKLAKTTAEYEKTIENPSLEYIQKKAGAHGHKVVHAESHDQSLAQLRAKISSLESDISSLKEEASEKQAVSDQVVKNLKERLAILQSKNDELNSKLVASQQEIEQLKIEIQSHQKQISAPTEKYLIEHGTKHGLVVLPKAAHAALLEKSNRTVHDLASEGGYVVLKNDEHKELYEKAHDPSIDHITCIAESKGHVAVPTDDFKLLQKKANRSLDEIATEHNIVAVPADDHGELLRKLNKPTFAELEAASKSLGLVCISEEQYKKVVSLANEPSADHLSLKAKALALVLVPESELSKLREDSAKLPSELKNVQSLEADVSLLKEDAAKKEKYIEQLTVALNEKERDLQREPILPKDSLLKQAAALGLVALTTSEHKSLKFPSKDVIAQQAESHDHIILPAGEYATLREKASKTLDDLANDARKVVLSYDEHDSLVNPTRDTLESHAKSQNLALVDDSTLDLLKKKSERTVQDLAEESGKIVLDPVEHAQLVDPPREVLESHASKLSCTLVPKSTLAELQKKSSRSARDLAEQEELILLTPAEHQKMVSPSRDDIANAATALGLSVIDNDDLQQMRVTIETPKLAFLTTKADSLGMSLVEKKRLSELVAHSNKSIEDHAKENGFVLMTTEKHKQLVHPDLDKVRAYAKNIDHVLIPKEDHAKLKDVSTLDVNDMTDRLKALGHVAIPEEEYSRLKDVSALTISDITPRLADLDHIAVPKAELSRLKDVDTLEVSDLTSRLSSLDHVAIPKDEHSKLKNIDHLEIDAFSDRLKSLGHVALPEEEFKKLKDLDSLEVHDFTNRLKTLGHVAVATGVYEKLAAGPTKDDITELCEKHGLRPLDKDIFEKLNSHESIISRAAELGLIAIPREDFDILKAKAEDPDKQTLEGHASNIGCVLIGKNEYESLQKITKKDLDAKAQKIDHVLITKAEYDDILGKMKELERAPLSPPAPTTPPSKFAATKDYFETVSRSGEKDSRKAKVFESAKSLGFVPVAADEYKHLLEHQKEHVVTKSDIYQKAKDFNLTVLPHDEYKVLLKSRQRDDLSLDEIKKNAQTFGFKLTPVAEPGSADTTRARGAGFTLLDSHSTTTLSSALNESEFTDALSRQPSNASTIPAGDNELHGLSIDEIRLQASAYGYTLVSVEDAQGNRATPDLLHDGASIADDEDDQTDDEHHDTLVVHDHAAAPTKEALSSQAHELGLVVLDQSDYDRLTSTDIDQLQLEEKAKALGMRVVSEADYSSFENPQEDKLRELSSKMGLLTLTQSEIDSIEQKAAADVRPDDVVTRENITQLGEKMQLKVIPSEEYADLVRKSKPSVLSKEDVERKAGELGLVTMSADQFDELKEKAAENASWSKEKIAAVAGAIGLSVIGTSESSNLKKPKTQLELSQEAEALGLSVIPVTELQKLTESLKLSDDPAYMKSKLESLGITSVPKDEYDALVDSAREISKPDLITRAGSMGLVVLPVSEHATLMEKSKDITKNELVLKAGSMGLVALPAEEHESLLQKSKDLTRDELLAHVQAMGLVAIDSDELENLKSRTQSSTHPLSVPAPIVTTVAKDLPPSAITKEDIIAKSAEFDMVVLPKSEFELMKMQSRPDSMLSKSDIVQRAMEYDLVAVSKEELEDLRSKAQSNREISLASKASVNDLEAPNYAAEDVESWAKSHDMLLIPEDAFVATNISRIPDPNNVVVLPVTYYNKLTKSETFSLDKVTNDELQAQARKRGFYLSTHSADYNNANDHLTRKNTITSLSSSTSRKNLADSAALAAAAELDQHSRVSRASSKGPSRSSSVAAAIPRDASIDAGLSLMTNASLSEPNIIPALTQTVIGEYLFKYYRRLGPLSSISESRHERYFWIHPYTLTLYWSSTNPVLGDPSAHKTRAAAIIGVESVEDNNPLPAGLYHKSIVVHSQNRSVRFTCPTRQRHNIWYNSLRYLIQRSMDGINLENDLGLPVQESRGRI